MEYGHQHKVNSLKNINFYSCYLNTETNRIEVKSSVCDAIVWVEYRNKINSCINDNIVPIFIFIRPYY